MSSASTSRVATPELITQLVEEIRAQLSERPRPYPEPLVVAARALPKWDHDEVLESANGPIEVATCSTPLAARRAIHDYGVAEPSAESTLVLLTDLADAELGADLLGRLVRPYLFALNPWEAVCQRFGVRRLDPDFGEPEYAWMADALLDIDKELIPRGTAMLSVDVALRAIAAAVLGAEDVSVERILVATADRGFAARVQSSDQNVLRRLCSTIAARSGPSAALVTGAIVSGHGEVALPAGLAARTVAGQVTGSFAQAKIEELTGVRGPTDDALTAWARASELAYSELTTNGDDSAVDLAVVGSELSRSWHAPTPESSDVLQVGFEARLEGLAIQLQSTLDAGAAANTSALREAVDLVVAHRCADLEIGRARAQRARLAAGLATWLSDPKNTGQGLGPIDQDGPANLTDAVGGYVAEGAWVDLARRRVGEGDESPAAFAEVLARIGKEAHEARAGGNERFASSLARWSTDGTAPELRGSTVVAVEDVLGEVVVPLARKQPVLLLVLDGCGLAQFLEFADQFRQYGMQEIGHRGERRCALAALPTVTEVSRTSLLSGTLGRGNASDEKKALREHPGVSKLEGAEAVLFHHRPDMVTGHGQGLPAPVSSALSADGPRLVAAVVNTIDDELSRGTFNPEYRIENLGPMPALLRGAVDAGRTVVVTADHGHVLGVGLDGKGDVIRSGEGGDRWRVADREPSDDEVLLDGPRVLLGGDEGVLMPWHDDLRYSAKHGGYHGGATPDECIVPLSVFLPIGMTAPTGWEQVASATPRWWDLHLDTAPEPPKQKTAPKRRKSTSPGKGQGSLFSGDERGAGETAGEDTGGGGFGSAAAVAEVAVPWMDALLASELYGVQLAAAGRAKPAEDRVRAALGALYARGGVANFAVVAQATGMPPGRVAGFLARLSQVLNIDGFGVLTVDAATQEARLDETLLRTQFLGATT